MQVYFSGSVQGVGFRFTCQRMAETLKISGWVKNLDDGRVEVVAEADQKTLEDFLGQLKEYFKAYIQDVDISWQEPEGLDEFKIRF